MKILALDDEYMGLMALSDAIKKAAPDAELVAFDSPNEAFDYILSNHVDAAFLDIFMAEMDGITLAKKIKLAAPHVHIVFQTGYDEYMSQAFGVHARGYVLKPVTKAKVQTELANIEELMSQSASLDHGKKHRIRFQCFGNFEVFADGAPLRFKYDKTKEMLAFLVSRRGALCSNNEIIANLWEDDANHDSYLRGIRKDLLDSLKSLGLEDIINQQRGKTGIDSEKVDCDYYDFINGEASALNLYKGEFMNQYSWGELINGEMSTEKYGE